MIPLLMFMTTAASLPERSAAVTLTFEEALAMAAAFSPDVRRAQADAALAAIDEPAVLANTDPEVTVSGSRRHDESPQSVPQIFGTRTIRDGLGLGIRKTTLIGTDLSLGLSADRTDANSVLRSFNPAVTNTLSFDIRQSLLRNFWGRPDRARRRQAHDTRRAGGLRIARIRDEAAARAGDAFLDLAAADRDQALRREGVEDARRFLAKVTEKRGFGLNEESDLAQASANLEVRELEAEQSATARRLARLRLLTAMAASTWLDSGAEVEPGPIPETSGSTASPTIEVVLDIRADVGAVRARESATAAKLRLAELQGLPQLTASAGYGYGGLGRTLGDARADLTAWDHPVWTAGLALTLPFSRARERVAIAAARLEHEGASADRAGLELRVRLELSSAIEIVALARRRLAAAVRLAELQRGKLDAERRSFERGRSSTEVLLRFAEDERQARREIMRAGIDLVKASLALRLARGESLTAGEVHP